MRAPSDRPVPDREPDDKYEVTPIEPFFDLVFVFAVSQLSHHWLDHMTWCGAAETVVLLLPVLGVVLYEMGSDDDSCRSIRAATCWNAVVCFAHRARRNRAHNETAIAAAPITVMTLAIGSAALAGTVALWALYFGRSEPRAIQHVETTSDPIGDSRFAMNGLTAMVAGLIAVAVGNQRDRTSG